MSDHGSSVIVTLFEGHYHMGLAALVNSLYRHGFRGTIYAGYRGVLPPWANAVAREGTIEEHQVADGCSIRFVKVETSLHLTNFKPAFMLRVWNELHPAAERVFYFDPDIVVKCPWSFFEEWTEDSVALVADCVMNPMPPDHPYRKRWAKWARSHVEGYGETKPLWSYYNAGFVGFPVSQKSALARWGEVIDAQGKDGIDLTKLFLGDRNALIAFPDQDALNIMAMEATSVLSTMGPESMDFAGGGTVMSHAAGSPKPWKKRFVRSALSGVPPSLADKNWLDNTRFPIEIVKPSKWRLSSLNMKIGAAIGRFIRRA